MSSGRYLRRAARVLPAAVALAIMPAILAGIGSGCGKGIFPQVTSSGSPSPTATAGTGAFLYASNFNDGNIAEFKRNLTTGALTSIATTTAGKKGVSGLTISPDNRFLYAADSGSNKVYEFRINANGSLARIGSGSIAAGSQPLTIAVDSTVSWAFTANQGSGGSVSQYSINSSNGTLTANGSNIVGFKGQPFSIVAHPSAAFIYVSDNQTGIIYSFTIKPDGTLQNNGTNNSLGNQPGNPGLISIVNDTASGNFYLYVPDTKIGVVSQFTIKTDGTLLFGQTWGTPSSDKPIGIAPANNAGGNNYLFTAEQTGNYVQYFLRSGASLNSQGALTGLNAPTGLVVDPKSKFAYTAEFSSATVAQMSILGACGKILCFVNRYNTESGSGGGTQFVAITN